MSAPRVIVTGMGLISAAGIGAEANWRRIVAGEPTALHAPGLDGCPVDFGCAVPDFDPAEHLGRSRAEALDRYAQLAMVAAEEAMDSAGVAVREPTERSAGTTDPARIGVVLGSLAGGTATIEAQQTQLERHGPTAVAGRTIPLGLVSSAAGALSARFGLLGASMSVTTACASGTTAIGTARDLIRTGALDVALAGGADAPLTPLNAAAYDRLRALSRRGDYPPAASRPFSATRDGFVLGEGAGFVVLESEEHARARGAPRLASIAGYGSAADGYHPVRPDPDGGGARRAILAALADAGMGADAIDYVNAHGTSTPLNDAVESAVVTDLLGDDVPVSSTKGVTGHPLGAAGALEAAYAVLALRDGIVPPTANLTDPDPDISVDLVAGAARRERLRAVLSNSFGFGGYNASLVITPE
ncbi:beta-ketoacyl-[acyl-carrier-protein] synthase family protein [Streptomyces varsoviensis]|uniref:3-oxoacyl-ACP synthase n=1 Tax=Streptomyces varsoviensis TaxID=67373 RepID=A0ABR5IVJ9_9ACTN|nr:beta-ketoacyl-[acyl-carrier-protein] synthase family protein [Streptomyces varsoviensis]KOG85176.1 3-oxoacyl-ACP synthase [Streptomyces varsoviensis]